MGSPANRMKPTGVSTSIDDLPPEMISELFKHLQPKDLVTCSMVNRRWHSIYAAFKMHTLAAFDFYYGLTVWYHSKLRIEDADRCRPSMFFRLAEKPLLSNLRRLALRVSRFELFDLNKLNRFRQLAHLEIKVDDSDEARVHLNLPKLKVLAFHSWSDHCALSIDCPLLSMLRYSGGGADLLKVVHPETIRKLDMYMFGAQLVPFKNVQCLVTEEFEAISKETLQSLPKLKELHYNQQIELAFSAAQNRHGVASIDRLKRTLSEFVGEAKKFSGSDFRFIFSGFELTKVNVDQIDFGVQVQKWSGDERVCNEYVYMKNYHLIEPGALDFVSQVNYPRLLRHVSGEFPRCFSQKFTNINWVWTLAEVRDADHFLWFLKSLRFLTHLELEKTGLGQEFYDQLPASALSLVRLVLYDRHFENELQLNFDFIGKLSRLEELEIRSALSMESLPLLVRSVGKLEGVQFDVRLREQAFLIKKTTRDSTKWTIQKTDEFPFELLFETENPDEILNFFEGRQD